MKTKRKLHDPDAPPFAEAEKSMRRAQRKLNDLVRKAERQAKQNQRDMIRWMELGY